MTSTPLFRTPDADSYRMVRRLVIAYAALSTLTVAAIVLFAAVDPALINSEAVVRGVIVAATSFLSVVFAARASRGDARALLRLRLVVAIILVAIVAVLLFVPLPTWMVIEQIACGVLLAAVAAVILRPTRRA
ncbi:hypothetical protein [Paractinoplanes globisporus]|uniref:Integral membrane protein n=1 Tax=Paractinoplanes globisporus TaxID=113565 RepID=A0ABW6WD60_9ACTN|nr:hypothetical protein [Actinoplanes globisporus]